MANPVISGTAPQWSKVGPGVNSVSVAPFNVGDLLVCAFYVNGGPATAVTGGGVAKWACASSYYDTTGSAYLGLWWGIITTPGTTVVTVTDAGEGADYGTIWVWEFTATGANWSPGSVSPPPHTTGGTPGTTGTPVAYPTLAPSSGGNDLYIGLGWSYFGHLTAGSTSGFLYANAASSGPNQVCWNPSVSTAVSPTSANDDGTYLVIAAMFTAGAGVVSTPAYAASYDTISGGVGSWTNPGNAVGVPSGSFATWTAP